MASQLKNIVTFTAVASGGQSTLAHGLNVDGLGVVPDKIEFDNGDFTYISADDTNLTVRNDGAAPANLNALCEHWHTIERTFGSTAVTALNPQPFVVEGEGGPGGVTNPLILQTGNAVVTAPAGQASAAIGHGASGGVGTAEVQVDTVGVNSGLAFGWVEPGGAGDTCRIKVSSEGGFAFGSAAGQGNGYLAEIEAGGQYATFAAGRAYPYNNGNCYIKAAGDAGFAQGYAGGYPATIYGAATGCFAQGAAYGGPSYSALIQAGQFTRRGAFAQGNATEGTIHAIGAGSFAQGYASRNATIDTGISAQGAFVQGRAWGNYGYAALLEATANGSRAMGYVRADDSDATMQATQQGATAMGYVRGDNAGYSGTIEATQDGAVASGAVVGWAPGPSVLRAAGRGSHSLGRVFGGLIETTGWGALGTGYVYSGGVIRAGFSGGARAHGSAMGAGLIHGNGYGATATGYAYGTGTQIQASDHGAFAHGKANSAGQILASNDGAFAGGYADGGGYVRSSGRGAFASGYSNNAGEIHANAHGSFALGYVNAAYDVYANGVGAFAMGAALTANVQATAANAFQFGQGVNALADTVQIGAAGLRLKQTTGAPGAPQNGDQWVAGGYVYIRSNGVSVKIV
jgi:hypothetical protein